MCKVMLATGMMVSYGYIMEHFIAWYSGNPYEQGQFFKIALVRAHAGHLLDDVLLQLRRPARLLVQEVRARTWRDLVLRRSSSTSACGASASTSSSPRCTATSCPSSWHNYAPTWVDISLFIGTIGLFSTLFLLFLKFVPAVAVTEVKELRHELEHEAHASVGGGAEAHG